MQSTTHLVELYILWHKSKSDNYTVIGSSGSRQTEAGESVVEGDNQAWLIKMFSTFWIALVLIQTHQ